MAPAARKALGYLAVTPASRARVRLFCFPHAGAGALAYAGWLRAYGFAPDISVVPVRLPGRESRLRQPCVTDPGRLLEDLHDELAPFLDAPYAFYGHSLGALVAHAFAVHHLQRGGDAPQLVAVGGCGAPHVRTSLIDTVGPGDADIMRFLRHTGGLDARVAGRPLWLRSLLEVIRGDLALARALRTGPHGTLPCPIFAVAGRQDTIAPRRAVEAWRRYTHGEFATAEIDGDHFFVRGSDLPRLLRSTLAGLNPVAAP
ncbi:surfactin synthase thioesterase subunit [Streptomyces sp. V3I8]|uniref:thioesterase II family protein n=1 Tax=Streptomyces sp. V3I8 TaxID=3042279 RepID=UPI0027802142|nr:thioesterase domain-containing protein [Streptomyces sp. V3I8]MDQ1041641.1 surfactin synthase thioesterase subunit [Streptomyces sp. V3I8]